MIPITLILFFALVTRNEYDDYSPTQYEYESNRGDDHIITTTTTKTTPVPVKDEGGGDKGWAIFGGVLGGLSAFAGLALLGRRFCKKIMNEHDKKKNDDTDVEYDYYGILHRRTSRSYA